MKTYRKAAELTGQAQGLLDYLKEANTEVAEKLSNNDYQSVELISRRVHDFNKVNDKIEELFKMIDTLADENSYLKSKLKFIEKTYVPKINKL